MRFLDAFFMINFWPLGIIALAGLMLFFSRGYWRENRNYPLLLIIIVLLVVSVSRIPAVWVSRRYAMPVMVPGIVLGVFFLMKLPGILKKYRVAYAHAVTGIFLAVLLLVCVAKALRFQKSKEYLHEIPEIIKQDCRENNIKRDIVLIVFGSSGGILDLAPNVKVIHIPRHRLRERSLDTEYMFANLKPERLKALYPRLYLLCREPREGSFALDWERKFHDKPELVYENTRAKNQTALRLFRLHFKSHVQ